MANPRIDELRKKLDKEPGSRLFAQLAEELRKDGDLEDAIRVAREGLQKHSNYPSARMTLGRALYDTGDWAAARVEFEQVLKGAADNILASRLLAESLENLGDIEGAVARYKKTLALAPGDKQVLARLDALQKGGTAVASTDAAAAPAAAGRAAAPTGAPAKAAGAASSAPVSPPAASAPPADASAPIRLSEVDTPMELESPHVRPPAAPSAPSSTGPPTAAPEVAGGAAAAGGEPAPIKVVAAEEHFELERPYEPPMPSGPSGAPAEAATPSPAASAAPAAAPGAAPGEGGMMEFEFDSGAAGGTMPFAPAPAPLTAPPPAPPPESPAGPPPSAPAVGEEPTPRAATSVTVDTTAETVPTIRIPPAPRAPEPAAPSAASPEATAADLMSPTLAELYFNQGFVDKAVEVYRQLLEREPDNERFQRRLGELKALGAPSAPSMASPAEAPARSPAAPPSAEPPPPSPPAPASAPTAAERAAAAPADAATRRLVLERTIARLEGMLAAIKKG